MNYEIIGGGRITEHFSLSEYGCNGVAYIDADSINFKVNVVEPFRVWYNRPININSGDRTEAKNKAVGGDKDSLHLYGRAIDFNLPAAEFYALSKAKQDTFLCNVKKKWFALCKRAGGCGQMTVHDGWLHLGMSLHREYYDDRRERG